MGNSEGSLLIVKGLDKVHHLAAVPGQSLGKKKFDVLRFVNQSTDVQIQEDSRISVLAPVLTLTSLESETGDMYM
jgi:hypothetical protein